MTKAVIEVISKPDGKPNDELKKLEAGSKLLACAKNHTEAAIKSLVEIKTFED